MVNNFDRQNLEQIRRDIDAALKQVMAKHNIDMSIANISFNAATFTTKLTARVKNTQVANQANSFSLRRLGLPENAIGRTIIYKGTGYEIVGINMKKRKYPITTKNVATGGNMNFTAASVAMLLGAGTGLPTNEMGG